MRKHIKYWRVTAQINMDANRHDTVRVKANTERKALQFAEEKIKARGAFYVTDIRAEEITEEQFNGEEGKRSPEG